MTRVIFFCFLIGIVSFAGSQHEAVALQVKTSPLPQSQTPPGKESIRIDASTVKWVHSPWKIHPIKTEASLRGLFVLNAQNIWASGTGGTVINSYNGGKTWRVLTIPGAEKLDIRDLHAFDEATVIAMTSGTPARIYRTTNAGLKWKLVYESTNPKVFLDALSFSDDRNGVVMGDPINGHLFLLKTHDGGVTWQNVSNSPKTIPGEGGFAASGTNMTTIGNKKTLIGLGGGTPDRTIPWSRVLISNDQLKTWKAARLPIHRSPTAGIFSLAFANDKNGVAVGGDYKRPDATDHHFAITSDGGLSWSVPAQRHPPSGYRSCVAVRIQGREIYFVAVGPNGTDQSSDLGKTWNRISNHGFHAIQFTPDGKHGWACGSNGRIAQWIGTR